MPYYDFYTDPTWWPLILTLTSMWKGMNGYLTYYACLMGVDPTLYEAAVIDGASRWQQRKYVSLPSLVPLICLYLIYAVAGVREGAYRPDTAAHAVYDALYREYVALHDLFGRGGSDVMKRLKEIRGRAHE